MKQLFILYLFFILCYLQRTHAQSYVPFPTDSVTWGVEKKQYVFDPFNPIIYTDVFYRLGSDTTISNLVYHQLTETGSNFAYSSGFLGEDSLKRIHYFLSEFQQDFVIYDFSLKVNESIVVPYSDFLDQMTLKVTALDSVIVGGSYRKRIFLEPVGQGYGEDEWIEGIGSIRYGLLYPDIFWVDNDATLTCFSHKDINYLTACPLNVSTEELVIKKAEIELFPNPAKDHCEIHINNNNNQTLSLYITTTDGRSFYNAPDVKFPAAINMSGWPLGMYIVNVRTQHSALTYKLIKE